MVLAVQQIRPFDVVRKQKCMDKMVSGCLVTWLEGGQKGRRATSGRAPGGAGQSTRDLPTLYFDELSVVTTHSV